MVLARAGTFAESNVSRKPGGAGCAVGRDPSQATGGCAGGADSSNMKRMRRLFPALAVSVVAAACSGDLAATVPTQPTSFAPPTVVETFTGSLATFGTASHPFSVPVPGEVDVTLTKIEPATEGSAAPAADTALVLAIGLPSTTTIGQCATLQSVSAIPGSTPQIKGNALSGTLCVSVSDPGKLQDAITYTVIVAHP